MKRIIKLTNIILALLLGLMGFTNCGREIEYGTPSADYVVKGKITDKATKQAVKGIRVSYLRSDAILPPYAPKYAESDSKGDYTLSEDPHNWLGDIPSMNLKNSLQEVYYHDDDGEENGLYRDTMIVVDFKKAKQTKKGDSWYSGEFTLQQNVELQKIEKSE